MPSPGLLLTLVASLAAVASAAASSPEQQSSSYREQLHLKPLHGHALYAGFDFAVSTPLSVNKVQSFNLFPRSLGQILQFTNTAELHLRFALGRWDDHNWGSRPRNGTKEGGTGVELWAWLEADTQIEAQKRWNSLVNSLSGLFCASLNFIEQTMTTQPILTFEPEGHLASNSSKLHLMHGMLPHEVVCTENLTPFLKLLPCKGKAGIASLLDGHKVFDANWQTMAIDVLPVCSGQDDCSLQVQQTVDMVLNLDRSMRPRDNPIPRPPPIEEINCDQNKHYNAHDTCYPRSMTGETEWSLAKVFGRPIKGSCPLGDRASNVVDILLEISVEQDVELVTDSTQTGSESVQKGKLRTYQLQENRNFDIKAAAQTAQPQIYDKSSLHASRQMTGYGQERGGMHAVIINSDQQAKRVVYLESLPWFLRPYMHTLQVHGATVEKMYYKPAIDRRKGTQLELLFEIPALSSVDLTYDFEKAVLRYTEYPPDANRGFDVAPAIIRALPERGTEGGQGSYMRTTSLLLPLPTPDFSMPYNVIILTSTVIALGFGSIFNLLIRRFVLLEEVPKSSLAERVKTFVANLRRRTPVGKAPEPETTNEYTSISTDEQAALSVSTGKDGDDGPPSAHLRRVYPAGKAENGGIRT